MSAGLWSHKQTVTQLDLNLYRVNVPLRGLERPNLSVVDIQPEGSRGTLLFIHGFAESALAWGNQINDLAPAYRLVVPDLRGHGLSDGPLTQYTMPELLSDLEAIVAALNLPARFTLVGHAFGGAIAS